MPAQAQVCRKTLPGKSIHTEISPLRCASVEMTKGRVVMTRSSGLAMEETAVAPLRCASVEMTKGRVVMTWSSGLAMEETAAAPLRYAPVEMTKGRS
jgi:hypothetical protein